MHESIIPIYEKIVHATAEGTVKWQFQKDDIYQLYFEDKMIRFNQSANTFWMYENYKLIVGTSAPDTKLQELLLGVS